MLNSVIHVAYRHELARIELEGLCSAVIGALHHSLPETAAAYQSILERIKKRGEEQ